MRTSSESAIAVCWLILLNVFPAMARDRASHRPNVLFIAIDDQNDWVGPLKGHPLVQTPHLDRLAGRGVVFLNAHCQAPLCNSSRTSLMLGLRPSTTGIYGLAPWFRTVEQLADKVTIPQYFAAHGYRTLSAGKIFHGRYGRGKFASDDFQVWGPPSSVGVKPPSKLIPPTPMGNHPLMDWGVFPHRDEEKGDYRVASWGVERLATMPADQPFFLAVGFFLPHVPCYATQKWFDLYPDDDRLLPLLFANDRQDTPRFSWYMHWKLPEPRLQWLQENNQHRNLVRSYLACTSFVDSQIGRLLAALEESPFADNTVVVVWSDHGWHLGEKEITGKNSLWERSTRVPLIFAGPGIFEGGKVTQPAELLDLYPTLVELCGLPAHEGLEGVSLMPQLQKPGTPRSRPAITTHNADNHAVRSKRWRFIHYADGTEELYDMQADPSERHNLAENSRYADILSEHRRWLPPISLPPAAGSAHRILTYDPDRDEAIWEGEPVRRSDPIPR